ncbi:MAG: hypothetical protein V4596_13510 [Bdellovibrionota bacterium]
MSSVAQHPLYIELSTKLHPQDFEVLKQILDSHELDLAPTYGYFEKNDFDQIADKSLEEFFKKIKIYDFNFMDDEDLRYCWSQTLGEFQKKYWGFKKHTEKPSSYREPKRLGLTLTPVTEIPKKPSKKISYKNAFFYIWSVLQSWIVIKALILVYGNDLAKDDSLQNRIIFGSIIAFSFGSLFLFAWMRRKNPK